MFGWRGLGLPLYEYKCAKCGHRFEKIESLSASEVKKCPKCGGRAERQLAPAAIQFKGSGWYVTDYAGKGKLAPASEGSGDGASKPAEKSDKPASTESKPAAKETTKKKK
jgi:putative FmdB family regulatory protein